jgi:predicted HAD superfamily Cof-like phosphohydrolase
MKNTDAEKKVEEFHKLFDLPVLDNPQIPSKDRCDLRAELLKEELNEFIDAIREKDLVEIADAFADLNYVLSGAILEFGIGDKYEEIFNEVHRSNMSKACGSIEEADKTIKHYLDKDGTVSYWVKKGKKYLVYRTLDNKVLKSINYSPANLKSILIEE